MYNWRQLPDAARAELLARRRLQQVPWHSPRHRQAGRQRFHLTGTCYEHQPFIGADAERMAAFEATLVDVARQHAETLDAYVLLPNHYHLLAHVSDLAGLLQAMFRLHQRTGYAWNRADGTKGRRVWCNVIDTAIKSERHYWATLNYIHHNPVKHGYVARWLDWPYSSAATYLAAVGRDEAVRVWQEYDISTMGDWDV